MAQEEWLYPGRLARYLQILEFVADHDRALNPDEATAIEDDLDVWRT